MRLSQNTHSLEGTWGTEGLGWPNNEKVEKNRVWSGYNKLVSLHVPGVCLTGADGQQDREPDDSHHVWDEPNWRPLLYLPGPGSRDPPQHIVQNLYSFIIQAWYLDNHNGDYCNCFTADRYLILILWNVQVGISVSAINVIHSLFPTAILVFRVQPLCHPRYF